MYFSLSLKLSLIALFFSFLRSRAALPCPVLSADDGSQARQRVCFSTAVKQRWLDVDTNEVDEMKERGENTTTKKQLLTRFFFGQTSPKNKTEMFQIFYEKMKTESKRKTHTKKTA